MLNKGSFTFLLIFISLAVGIFILRPVGQNRNEAAELKPIFVPKTDQDIRDTFPIVGYPGQFSSDEDKRKSEKYDKGLGLLPFEADIPRDLEAAIALDWSKDLKALPVDQSDVILVGKVVDAKAHLSLKRRSVFSEFRVEIENILKDSGHKAFENKKILTAEREGGIVRYPSGHKFWYRVPGQRMPRIGERYLLFLTDNFPIYGRQKQDLYLLTGYELKEGLVFPLDNPGDSHPLVSTYNGLEESKLFRDLNTVLKIQ